MTAIVELERVRAARDVRPRPPAETGSAADSAATTGATILLFTGVRYERRPPNVDTDRTDPPTDPPPAGTRPPHRDVIVLD